MTPSKHRKPFVCSLCGQTLHITFVTPGIIKAELVAQYKQIARGRRRVQTARRKRKWVHILAALMLTTATLAQAQQLNMPKTIKLHNNATGEHLGTITYSDGRAYIRDKDGKHYATIVRNPDGSTTTFDPSGNIIEPIKLPE